MSRTRKTRAPTGTADAMTARFVIEESLGYLVNAAARLFARSLHHRISRHGVPIGQWPFLMFLWEEEGLTQKALSDRIPIDEATTVRTLDRMERDGRVRRARNPHDRRETLVFLTEAGRALEKTLLPYATEVNEHAMQGLDQTQRTHLTTLLQGLIARLETDHAPWPARGSMAGSRTARSAEDESVGGRGREHEGKRRTGQPAKAKTPSMNPGARRGQGPRSG